MKCPRCEGDTDVINSRGPESPTGEQARALVTLLGVVALRWRRRKCLECDHRFNTAEVGVSLLRQLVEAVSA